MICVNPRGWTRGCRMLVWSRTRPSSVCPGRADFQAKKSRRVSLSGSWMKAVSRLRQRSLNSGRPTPQSSRCGLSPARWFLRVGACAPRRSPSRVIRSARRPRGGPSPGRRRRAEEKRGWMSICWLENPRSSHAESAHVSPWAPGLHHHEHRPRLRAPDR